MRWISPVTRRINVWMGWPLELTLLERESSRCDLTRDRIISLWPYSRQNNLAVTLLETESSGCDLTRDRIISLWPYSRQNHLAVTFLETESSPCDLTRDRIISLWPYLRQNHIAVTRLHSVYNHFNFSHEVREWKLFVRVWKWVKLRERWMGVEINSQN